MSIAEFHESRAVKANQSYRYMWDRYINHEKYAIGENQWGLFNAMTHWATHAPASNEDDGSNILSIRERRNQSVHRAISHPTWEALTAA